MKKILNILMIASVLLFAGCEDEVSYEKGPQSSVDNAVYFTGDDLGIEIEPTDEVETLDVTIARTNFENALTVPLKVVTNTDNVFKVPETISFDAGEEETTIEVTYQGLAAGKTHYLQFEVDQSKLELNPYKECWVKISATDSFSALPVYKASIMPIPWSEVKTGVYLDDAVGTWYGPMGPWYVEYRTADLPNGTKKVKLLNPYNRFIAGDADEAGIYPACPGNNASKIDATKDYHFNMLIDGEKVSIEDAAFGINWGDGMMGFAKKGKGDGKYDAEAGSITFDAADKILVIYDDDGLSHYVGFSFFFTKDAYVKYAAESGDDDGE